MALPHGTRIGSYEIVGLLGAGGMGEVYRARDPKLNRDVALKILPAEFAADPDRLARFKREAQVLAALNDPNIAQIFGFEDSGAVHALVLELVEGPTLADQLKHGPIGLSDALPIARQIALAVETAHERGVIHRDLKPGNIKVRADGTVKVLDFGLAKALDPTITTSDDAAMSPTMTGRATQMGMILGTAAYMSPEQARGRPVDRRADIWAFGVVVFEMLAGRRAFEGDDVSITIAAVLKDDVKWSDLPADLPPAVRLLLHRCLEKDPKRRLQAIGEARVLIDDLVGGAAPAATLTPAAERTPSRTSGRLWAAAGLVAVIASSAAAFWIGRRTQHMPTPSVVRFAVAPPADLPLWPSQFDRVLDVSPDGRFLVYQGQVGRNQPLTVRTLDRIETTTIAGTAGARFPSISPAGKWIVYFSGNDVVKVPAGGGEPPTVLCRNRGGPRGAAAGEEIVVFANSDTSTGLQSVPIGSGEPNVLTTPDTTHGESDHLFPSMLPGGRAVLFTITANGPPEKSQIAVLDLSTRKYKTVLRGTLYAQYVQVPEVGGYLVYQIEGTLRAVRFDLQRMEPSGDSVQVLEGVGIASSSGVAQVGIGQNGTLAYMPGRYRGPGSANVVVWKNRKGQETPVNLPPRTYINLRLSPDGTKAAFAIRDQENDIWIWDIARGASLVRLTFGPTVEDYPVWSSDSRRLFYASQRNGSFNVFSQLADQPGSGEPVHATNDIETPTGFSRDGLVVRSNAHGNDDLILAPIEPKAGPRPLLHSSFDERTGEISVDGNWIAYGSDQSGGSQIYVRPFPNTESSQQWWQISQGVGSAPVWAPNGRELLYSGRERLDAGIATGLMTVPVQTSPTFTYGKPIKLFDLVNFGSTVHGRYFDVARDGRILLIKSADVETNGPTHIVVVLNWLEELKAKFSRR